MVCARGGIGVAERHRGTKIKFVSPLCGEKPLNARGQDLSGAGGTRCSDTREFRRPRIYRYAYCLTL